MVKRKIRKAKKAVLFVGEGSTEKAFLGYLKELFHKRGCGISVKIESGDGGSPDYVIVKAMRLMQYSGYDVAFVLVDDDVRCSQKTRREAGKKKITILQTTPCIEGLFLEILQYVGFNSTTTTTAQCKKIFHKNYMAEKLKFDKNNYAGIFLKALLEKQRENVPTLDHIISIFEIGI